MRRCVLWLLALTFTVLSVLPCAWCSFVVGQNTRAAQKPGGTKACASCSPCGSCGVATRCSSTRCEQKRAKSPFSCQPQCLPEATSAPCVPAAPQLTSSCCDCRFCCQGLGLIRIAEKYRVKPPALVCSAVGDSAVAGASDSLFASFSAPASYRPLHVLYCVWLC